MSRLSIVHDTVYRYRKPVRFGLHRLVLRPREGHDVDIAAMAITAEPSFQLRWSRDVFGNSIATLELLERHGVDYAQGYHLGRPAPAELVFNTKEQNTR